METDREPRDAYQNKGHGKRVGGPYGHLAPPPKMRLHERTGERDENIVRVNGSDTAWSTEYEETY